MNKEDLLKLINDDTLGLLDVTAKNIVVSEEERLVASFDEITSFVHKNGREPILGSDLGERQLASRLGGIRADKNKKKILIDFDECNLLDIEEKEIKTVHDVVADDKLGLLDEFDQNLFDLKNVPEYKERECADFVARRKPCIDFEKYETMFQECQKELSTGKRKLLKFSEEHLKEKTFFVMDGILLFLEKINDIKIDKNSKKDGRIRCIFENGTESGMLLRSLGKGLYENGYTVSENIDTDKSVLEDNLHDINQEDMKTGYIYVLKSLSEDPKIKAIDNLFKIGFSTVLVEERVKMASVDPTYLMAPVKIITTFDCYNINPQKLELLLHNFFGSACVNLDIFDADNKRHTPREWFVAPLEIIEKAIGLIVSGGIVNYKYDMERKEIVLK